MQCAQARHLIGAVRCVKRPRGRSHEHHQIISLFRYSFPLCKLQVAQGLGKEHSA